METMPKIISVSVTVDSDPASTWRLYVATCEDGSVWQREHYKRTVHESRGDYHFESYYTDWEQLP